MLRKLYGCLTAFGLTVALSTVGPMQSSMSQDIATDRFAELLEDGIKLERDHRWQEAIQQYEKLHRKFPQRTEVDRRLQIVRVHFDVTRRYNDKSFIATIDESTPTAALELFVEVINKLQVYYVDPIDLNKLVRNGTAFLEVALVEEDFLVENVSPSVSTESVESFRANIHKSVVNRSITDTNEARNVVAHVATLARDQIGLPPTAVIYEYIAGSIGLLDPYSAYLTVGEYQEIMSQIEGNLIGLGVELWAEGNELRIVEVFGQGPAYEAGLLKNDKLIEIGGVRVEEVGAKRAADLLRGPENSVVKIAYLRNDSETLQCEVRRRRVEVPSVSQSAIIDRDAGVGYLRISNFQKTTAREVDDAMKSLHNQGLKSLIIDLRRNPGGLLDSAVDIADKFLYSGAIVSTRGRNGQENHNYTAKMPGTWDVPLIVMIDEDSASASEIFAGAIRDQERGIIVGRTSYGKGSVQGVFHNETNNGGGMRLTVSKFFSPAGYAISARGVEPDIVFEDPKSMGDRTASKFPVSLKPSNSVEIRIASEASRNNYDEVEIQRAVQVAKTELPKRARRR